MTFFLRFQWLCKMCNRDPDDCTALFVEKLRYDKIKECVRTANFTDEERYNCEHLASYSERLETSLKLRNVGGGKTVSVGAVSSSRGGRGNNRGNKGGSRGGANSQTAQSHTQSSTQSDGRASPQSQKGVEGGGGLSETASVSFVSGGRRCYTCDGHGHISTNCPTKKLNDRGITVFRG